MYPIARIENAIIRRIHEARLPYLRFVGSYGGELMGEWQAVYRAVPAVWVAFDGADESRPLNTARTRWESRLRFCVVCAAYSPRAEAARTGGPAGVGAYDMLADVAALTALQDYGLEGVDYLVPGRIRSLFSARVQGASLAVFAQDWTCRAQVRLRAPASAPWAAPPAGIFRRRGYLCRALPIPATTSPRRRWPGWPCATGASLRRTRTRTRRCWRIVLP